MFENFHGSQKNEITIPRVSMPEKKTSTIPQRQFQDQTDDGNFKITHDTSNPPCSLQQTCGNHSTQNIKTCHAKNETNTMIGFKICGCMFTCCFIFCFVDTCGFGLHKINKKQNLHQLHAYMHLLVLIKRLDTNLQLIPNHHRKFKKSIGKPKSTFSNIKKDMFPKLFLSSIHDIF